ncbi:MAG TPA: amino acid ABC transporter substrate-binding protein [Ktedonobacteraceae bacterium]|nr:amino acid ABC transporter substrate-binding protein [Ktedonobacteraceae bacterium]
MLTGSTGRTGKLLVITLAMLMALAGLSACAQQDSSTTAQNKAPVKIGVSLSLTGDREADGVSLRQGYEMWRDDINKRGGLLGRQVQLDIVNDNSDANQVITNYNKLISIDKVDLVFGPFSSVLTYAGAPVVNRYGYAYIAGTGGIDKIYDLNLKTYFNVSLPIRSYLDTFTSFILSLSQDKRPETVAYIGEDNPFSTLQLAQAQKELQVPGGPRTVLYQIYPEETTDYTPLIQKVIRSNADVVILGTHVDDCIAFIKGFKQQHFNPRSIIATGGPDAGAQFTKGIGGSQVAEGIFVPNGGWYPDIKTYQNDQFTAEYLTKNGGTAADINSDAVQGYSVGQILEQAVNAAKSLDNAKIIQVLHSNTFHSLQGDVKFSAKGENILAVPYLFQWQKGQYIPVFPVNSAQANPEYPKPTWPA